MVTKFNHAIDNDFIEKLRAETEKNGWWSDVLADPTLLVALRGTYLNVYWQGQSLFHVEPTNSGLNVTTHEKFLIDPALDSQVKLTDGFFDIAGLRERGFIGEYKGKATLAKMKRAASYFSGLEKRGCHKIATNNPSVIDCEIAFPGFVLADNGTEDKKGRVDLASLEQDGEHIQLVFWEAKHYSNKGLRADLRSDDKIPPVRDQVEKYQKYLSAHRDTILDSYTMVTKNLVAIQSMGAVRRLSSSIVDVGTGKRSLVLDKTPKVGLIIFGFNEAEREHMAWKEHLKRLTDNISPFKAVGESKQIKL